MRRIEIAALAFIATATLAACSSGDPAPAPTSQTPSEHGSYAQCLTEHGIPAAPGPMVGPPPGVDPDTWQQALQACSTLAPGPAH